MAPKKSPKPDSSNVDKSADGKGDVPEQASDTKAEPQKEPTTKNSEPNGASSKKRKAGTSDQSNKAPRRSARGNAKPTTDSVKLLNYLLSPSSLDLCRPKDEMEDLKTWGQSLRTYSTSKFSPFEELLCATILSRPIGHMLGLRSIRTIFNPPYELNTPKKIREANYEGCREALDTARTQHRQKTAEELVLLANAVVDHLGAGEEDVNLNRVREESGHDAEKEKEMLKKHIKGVGKTGLEIFGRRIQGVWPEFFPFIDEKTSVAVEKLGLPSNAVKLKELIEKHWDDLVVDDLDAKDAEEKKRKSFVRILERAVGADLEGNVESITAEVA